MKLAETRDDVLVGGAVETDAFTIKASAKAFQILSSNLYSNPLGSMIRELSTNAYDAHIMVGTPDKPFHIKLPNSLEPTFKIRDWGPGLSEQEIKTVYTTFFESTKTDSNDVVGCLGLGSKSPFGVADSFTINSFYNGTKTVYSSFLNDQRIPSIAKFHSEPTNEANGIEIEVAIKTDDIHTFAREVNDQLKYFKTKPTITGNISFEWQLDEQYLYEGSNWKMVDTDKHYYYRDRARVVQGQIAYPISTKDMGTIFDNASPAVRDLLDRNILFEVPIGDVNIAPSREALSYDETTSQNIVKAAEKVVEELPGMLAKTIQDTPTMWEARIKYNKIMFALSGGHYGVSALKQAVTDSGKILWKNKDVSDLDIIFREEYATKITGFNKYYCNNNRFKKNNYYLHNDFHDQFKGKKKIGERFWTITARSLDNFLVVFATPDDKAVEARTKQFANDNYNKNVKIAIIETEKSYETIKGILGIPALFKAAELPKIRRNKKVTRNNKNGPLEIPVQSFCNSWNKSDQWYTEYVADDLLDLEGYYIRLDKFDAEFEGRKVEIKDYWSAAKELGLVDTNAKLWGLRKMNRKRPHKLIDFFEYCKLELEKIGVFGITYGGNLSVARKLQEQYRDIGELKPLVKSDSPARIFIDKILSFKDTHHRRWDTKKLFNLLGFDQENKKENIDDIAEPLETLYPMIGQLGYVFSIKQVAQYINDMDELFNCRQSRKEN